MRVGHREGEKQDDDARIDHVEHAATSAWKAGTSSWPKTPTTVVAVTWSEGHELSVAAATRNGDSDANPV